VLTVRLADHVLGVLVPVHGDARYSSAVCECRTTTRPLTDHACAGPRRRIGSLAPMRCGRASRDSGQRHIAGTRLRRKPSHDNPDAVHGLRRRRSGTVNQWTQTFTGASIPAGSGVAIDRTAAYNACSPCRVDPHEADSTNVICECSGRTTRSALGPRSRSRISS
jgi:hypothetical protein